MLYSTELRVADTRILRNPAECDGPAFRRSQFTRRQVRYWPIPVVRQARYIVAMRTKVSNEITIKQYSLDDGKRVLSIIPCGKLFRFVEEKFIHQAATSALGAYDYWEETYRSGLYETVDVVEREAEAAISQLTRRNSE